MDRTPGTGPNIRRLAALLAPPVSPVPTPASASAPTDPVADLERQRQQVLEAAKREGYAAGIAEAEARIREGQEQARDEVRRAHAAESERLADAHRRLGMLLKSVEAAADGMAAEIGDCVAEVAYAAVVRFLGEAGSDGQLLRRVCQQALEEYQQRPVVLKVSKDDVDAIKTLAADTDVSIEADSRLRTGQCRLQTRKGDYDTSVEVRLESLKLAFLRGLDMSEAPA